MIWGACTSWGTVSCCLGSFLPACGLSCIYASFPTGSLCLHTNAGGRQQKKSSQLSLEPAHSFLQPSALHPCCSLCVYRPFICQKTIFFDISYYGQQILNGIQQINTVSRIRDFSRICAVYLCAEAGCTIAAVPLFWAGCHGLRHWFLDKQL